MYISATTTLVGREEAEADALLTLASDWSDSTAKSELVSNRGLEEHAPAASICRECGANPWSSWARGTEQEEGIKEKTAEYDTHRHERTRTTCPGQKHFCMLSHAYPVTRTVSKKELLLPLLLLSSHCSSARTLAAFK